MPRSRRRGVLRTCRTQSGPAPDGLGNIGPVSEARNDRTGATHVIIHSHACQRPRPDERHRDVLWSEPRMTSAPSLHGWPLVATVPRFDLVSPAVGPASSTTRRDYSHVSASLLRSTSTGACCRGRCWACWPWSAATATSWASTRSTTSASTPSTSPTCPSPRVRVSEIAGRRQKVASPRMQIDTQCFTARGGVKPGRRCACIQTQLISPLCPFATSKHEQQSLRQDASSTPHEMLGVLLRIW